MDHALGSSPPRYDDVIDGPGRGSSVWERTEDNSSSSDALGWDADQIVLFMPRDAHLDVVGVGEEVPRKTLEDETGSTAFSSRSKGGGGARRESRRGEALDADGRCEGFDVRRGSRERRTHARHETRSGSSMGLFWDPSWREQCLAAGDAYARFVSIPQDLTDLFRIVFHSDPYPGMLIYIYIHIRIDSERERGRERGRRWQFRFAYVCCPDSFVLFFFVCFFLLAL